MPTLADPAVPADLAVLQLIAAALASLTTVAAGKVYVERASAVTRDECPVVNLLPGDAAFEPYGSDGLVGQLHATLPVTVRIHTRGDPHSQLAAPVVREVHRVLMADQSLGGWALRLRVKAMRKQLAEADATAGTTEVDYEAQAVVDEATLALQQG